MGLKKTFRRFWISFGILLFIIRSHSPLCSLFLHSNLLETNFKIVRNEFIEPTLRKKVYICRNDQEFGGNISHNKTIG